MADIPSSSSLEPDSMSTDSYDIPDFPLYQPSLERARGRSSSRRRAGSRGRAKGRGERGRGERARGRGERARGRGERAVRAPATRGRGGTRGKRKQTGAFQFSEDDIERLQDLRAARKRKADDLIDDLSEEGKTVILKEVVDTYPSLILNISERLQKESGPAAPTPDPGDTTETTWPTWCICRKCREMPTDAARVCCGMQPHLCHSLMPEMSLSITDEGALTIQRIYRNDMFARHNATEEDHHKAMRHAAYRQYILFQYGRLGRGVRKPVPSCVTWFIRDKFPDPFMHYVEYVPSW